MKNIIRVQVEGNNANNVLNILQLNLDNKINNDGTILWKECFPDNLEIIVSNNFENYNIKLVLDDNNYKIYIGNEEKQTGEFNCNEYLEISKFKFTNDDKLLEDKFFIENAAIKYFGKLWSKTYDEESKYKYAIEKLKDQYDFIQNDSKYNQFKKNIDQIITDNYINFLVINNIDNDNTKENDAYQGLIDIVNFRDEVINIYNFDIYNHNVIKDILNLYLDLIINDKLTNETIGRSIEYFSNDKYIEQIRNIEHNKIHNIIQNLKNKYAEEVFNNIPTNINNLKQLIKDVAQYDLNYKIQNIYSSQGIMKELCEISNSDLNDFQNSISEISHNCNDILINLIIYKCKYIDSANYTNSEKLDYYMNTDKLFNRNITGESYENNQLMIVSMIIKKSLNKLLENNDVITFSSSERKISLQLEKILSNNIYNNLLNPQTLMETLIELDEKYNQVVNKYNLLYETNCNLEINMNKNNSLLNRTDDDLLQKMNNIHSLLSETYNKKYNDLLMKINNDHESVNDPDYEKYDEIEKRMTKLEANLNTFNNINTSKYSELSDKLIKLATSDKINEEKYNEIIQKLLKMQNYYNSLKETNDNTYNIISQKINKMVEQFSGLVGKVNSEHDRIENVEKSINTLVEIIDNQKNFKNLLDQKEEEIMKNVDDIIGDINNEITNINKKINLNINLKSSKKKYSTRDDSDSDSDQEKIVDKTKKPSSKKNKVKVKSQPY